MTWSEVPLEQLAVDDAPIVYGILKPGPDTPDGVPYVRPSEMGARGIDLDSILRTTPKIAKEFRRSTLKEGDLILSIVGTIGKIAFVPRELDGGNITQCSVRIRAEPRKVDARYLSWALESPRLRRQYDEYRFGSGVPRLNVGHVRALKVPLPPLAEQRRIADILDKADAIRRKRKQSITLTDTLLRSTFLDLFGDPITNPKGWPVKPLGELAEDMTYGTSVKCSGDPSSGLPVLRIPNVAGGAISWNDLKYASLGRAEEGLRLHTGDLLFVRTNGNPAFIARCAVYDGAHEAVFASYLIRVRLHGGCAVLPEYVRAALSADTYRAHLTSEARTTAGNYNISTVGLRRLPVPTPPIELQRAYMTLERETRAAHRSFSASEAYCAGLGEGLAHLAFAGKL
jgi:type I restriction enzyme S subunit